MRGLETRQILERSQQIQPTDPTEATYLLAAAMIAAQSEGWRDAAAERYQPPPEFCGQPTLLHWWDCGQGLYASYHADIRDCRFCNDGTTYPCRYHG